MNAAVAVAVALAPGLLAQGQASWRESTVVPIASTDWTGARLPDGQPDVQGHWSNTIGNHNNLTDPQGGGTNGNGEGGRRARPREARAPSRISDPADGQMPLQPWARALQQDFAAHLEDPIRPEYVEPLARCAPGGPTKSFMWHGYEIRQYAGTVLLLFDSGTRVIHLDSPAHPPASMSLWNGDSRGRWEGNTLVVDVANNNSKARFARTGEFVSEHAHIVERYVFSASGDRFNYSATYTDPSVLTRPFTITIPNKRVTADTPADDWNNQTFPAVHDGSDPIIEMYERTCVEGNGEHGGVATGY
jgi:hypothetical protein